MTSFIIFVAIAVIAHFLVWQWRPWLPGVNGYASLSDGVTTTLAQISSLIV
jgi:light-harvesting complex 1 beta chain